MCIQCTASAKNISIHALREEGDYASRRHGQHRANFYPRPPRGGRPKISHNPTFSSVISIHALREEGDWQALLDRADPDDFYPRPPRGGRLLPHKRDFAGPQISIHALREEGDAWICAQSKTLTHFYPRPPRGGRRFPGLVGHLHVLFLSTPSARRATVQLAAGPRLRGISIHALREEGDPPAAAPVSSISDFYPRPPRGGRPTSGLRTPPTPIFLSTPSARRATFDVDDESYKAIFLSTPSARRATWSTVCWPTASPNFYPRPPRGGRRVKNKIIRETRKFLSTPSARRATTNNQTPARSSEISIHALREEGDAARSRP